MILAYVLVSIAYLAHGWGHELASLEGDEFIYLLSAEHFSPWTPHSPVAAYVAGNSPSPPLFPLLLSLTGGAQNILAANIMAAMLMLSSSAMFFFWLRAEEVSEWRAFLLATLFAVLPGTYMHALFVMSEGLYLILSMAGLLAVAKSENTRDDRWLSVAAICVAAATLTRSAGWALIAAFAVYLLWRRNKRTWQLLAVAALPAIAWTVYKKLTGGSEGLAYSGLFLEWYTKNPIWKSTNPISVLFYQVGTEAGRFWKGLSADFTTISAGTSIFGVVGILFLFAAAYRSYLRKLDGFYVIFYTAMILIWPFSYAANAEKRFVLVIIPILMFQAWYLIGRLSRSLFRRLRFNPAEVIYFSAIALLALPAMALVTARYFELVPQDLEPYRRVGWWYNWYWKDSMVPEYRYMKSARVLSEGLPKIAGYIPEDDCIYSVKPYTVSFYTRRVSKYPPKEALNDADFSKALHDSGCRYFFFMNDISQSFSNKLYYPEQRMGDVVEPIADLDYAEGKEKVVMGILGKLK
ncbi:MAG: glycosyltransferase family 39 protein [Proteobacteria bacterium]|nr:glycosyltransferase family 39 protein [Pseudomonadota bacterium]